MADYAKEFAQAQQKALQKQEELKNNGQKQDYTYQRRATRDQAEDFEKNRTDDAYKGKPTSGQTGNWQQPRGAYRGSRGGNYQNTRGGSYNNNSTTPWRGRGGYQNRGEDVEQVEGADVRPRGGYRGRGTYNNQNVYIPRGSRGRGNYRGGQREQQIQNNDDVDYRSNDANSEDDAHNLSQKELDFIDRKLDELSDQLKGIVSQAQIERKCVELEFSEEKLQDWVDSLKSNDKRVVGLKEYEWNDTVTKEEKHTQRIKKLVRAKNREEQNEKLRKQRGIEIKKANDVQKFTEFALKKLGDRIVFTEAIPADKEYIQPQEFLNIFEKYGINKEDVQQFLKDENVHNANLIDCLRQVVRILFKNRRNHDAKERALKTQNEQEQKTEEKVDLRKQQYRPNQPLIYKKKESTQEEAPKQKVKESDIDAAFEEYQKEKEKEDDEIEDEGSEPYYDEEEEPEDQELEVKDRKDSDEENAELLRQAATQARTEQEDKERKERVEVQKAAEEAQKAKARVQQEALEAEQSKRKQEDERKKEEERQLAEQQRKLEEQKQFQANNFGMMMPMPLSFSQDPKAKSEPLNNQQQAQIFQEQQQMLMQQMALHQQMFQQYQAMLAQQFTMQQALLGQGNPSSQPPQPIYNPFAMGMPMMGGLMPPQGVDTNASATSQQQMMGMPNAFMPPMGMMYPGQANSTPNMFGGYPMMGANLQNPGAGKRNEGDK